MQNATAVAVAFVSSFYQSESTRSPYCSSLFFLGIGLLSPCLTNIINTIAMIMQTALYRNNISFLLLSIIRPAMNGVIACADIVAV